MEIPAAAKSYVAVYRSNYQSWRVDLAPVRYMLLFSIQQGKTLSETLDSCLQLPRIDSPELSAQLEGWFKEWATDGLFCAMRTQPTAN